MLHGEASLQEAFYHVARVREEDLEIKRKGDQT